MKEHVSLNLDKILTENWFISLHTLKEVAYMFSVSNI